MTDIDELNTEDLSPSAPTVPENEYLARIADPEIRDTKSGGGKYINYRAVILSGPYAGKSVFGMWTTKAADGKQDTTYQTRGDLKRLGIEGKYTLADLDGLEGYVKITEQFRKDRDTNEVTEEKENKIKKWLRRA